MNETRQYEDPIDLLALMVQALRKWPVLLAAMLIGAMLLGGYKWLVPVDRTSEVEALQSAIDANRISIENNEETIKTNELAIEDYKEKIVEDKELLPVREEQLTQWEELLFSLKNSLKESQGLLTDLSLTADQYAAIIMQINTLAEKILTVSAQVEVAEQRIPNTETEIKNLEKGIETLEDNIENIIEVNEELREQIDEQEAQIADLLVTRANVSLKTVMKYAILGAALGAFIFCVVIFLQFSLDHRLHTSCELKEKYNFLILGEFSSEAAKKHGKFGQWLDKLSGDVQAFPGERHMYELIAAGVQALEATLPMRLAVTGTVSKEILEQIGEQLKSLLPDTYKIEVETNPVYNAAFLVNLKQYTVLLVEAKGISDKREIEKLAGVLHRNEVKVIGAVVK
ncbi:MAG: hypothetical protein J1F18_06975 [Lachnospiraceae bacterium]|nr:hypothetical protein [Lachnospiraceae bacterium]